jgi:hypothetical protein
VVIVVFCLSVSLLLFSGYRFYRYQRFKKVADEVLNLDPVRLMARPLSLVEGRTYIVQRWHQADTLLRYQIIRYVEMLPWEIGEDFPETIKAYLCDWSTVIEASATMEWRRTRKFPFLKRMPRNQINIRRIFAQKSCGLVNVPEHLIQQALKVSRVRIGFEIAVSEVRRACM